MSKRGFPRPLAVLLFFCACFCAPAAQGLGRVECRAVSSKILGRDVRYCALLPSSYDEEKSRRYPVLYYLHGLNMNEQALVDSGAWAAVDNLREEAHIGEFLIVAPNGGRSFYINSRDGRERYEDFFISEFIPAIERTFRILADRNHRGISGMSMGGYGALHLAFLHPDLFGSVSAHSAALIANFPSANGPVKTDSPQLAFFGRVFGNPLDLDFWNRSDPLHIAKEAEGLKRLKIYFDCGAEDDYGFEVGAQKLDEELKARGIRHEFHIYPGRHDWVYFANHLQDSLAFHSRAFGVSSGS